MSLRERQEQERKSLQLLRDSITEDMSVAELCKKIEAFADWHVNPANHIKAALTVYLDAGEGSR